MNAKQELQLAVSTAELCIVETAHKGAVKEESRHFIALGRTMTWKEYVECFDKHLHTELILSKVIF
jgi:hypothetical protein